MKPILFAKRFIAGESLSDAIRVAKELKSLGIDATLDHLGEDVTNRSKANKSTTTYIRILQRIKKENLRSNISVKLSQVGLAISKELAFQNVKKILKEAKNLELVVEFDIEGSRYLNDTLSIYQKITKKYPSTIQAVQSYLYSCEADVREIMRSGGKIRLVKGAYAEPKNIAYQEMNKIRKNFKKILRLYLEQGKFVAIGTHDEEIIKYAKRLKVPKKKYEFEMLHGVRRDLQHQLTKEGHAVRVYVPYGTEWFPYFYRRIMERKENLFFAVKHILGK